MKYIGVDSNRTKEKYKKFIEPTLLMDTDHSKKIMLKADYDISISKLVLKITDDSALETGEIVIDCGALPAAV
jgi:hypothetical protein